MFVAVVLRIVLLCLGSRMSFLFLSGFFWRVYFIFFWSFFYGWFWVIDGVVLFVAFLGFFVVLFYYLGGDLCLGRL